MSAATVVTGPALFLLAGPGRKSSLYGPTSLTESMNKKKNVKGFLLTLLAAWLLFSFLRIMTGGGYS